MSDAVAETFGCFDGTGAMMAAAVAVTASTAAGGGFFGTSLGVFSESLFILFVSSDLDGPD